MKNKLSNILLIKVNNSSFINLDETILKNNFNTTTYFYGTEKGIKSVISSLKLLLYLIRNLRKFKYYYLWFADYSSVIPAVFAKIFNKKLIIVLGGYDVAKIPELNYGGHIKNIRSAAIKLSCNLSYKLIAVSQYVKEEALQNISNKLFNKIEVIYNTIDTEKFKITNQKERLNQIICVSAASSKNRAILKGIDRVIDVAIKMPNYKFIIVGISKEFLEQTFNITKPENIETVSFINHSNLITVYNQSKIVLQLSVLESFGVAVVEGMACGCVPVTSNVGGLKELSNSSFGYKIDRANTPEICDAIIDGINTFNEKYLLASAEVTKRFNSKTREKAIADLIK